RISGSILQITIRSIPGYATNLPAVTPAPNHDQYRLRIRMHQGQMTQHALQPVEMAIDELIPAPAYRIFDRFLDVMIRRPYAIRPPAASPIVPATLRVFFT